MTDLSKEMSLLLRVAMNFALVAVKELKKEEQEAVKKGAQEIKEIIKTPEVLASFFVDSITAYVDDEQAFQKTCSLVTMTAVALKEMGSK